jgi:hypothetical protein
VDPHENIHLARFLREPPRNAPSEASFRCACGRAYYAAHAIVRDLLTAARFQLPRSGDAHGHVVNLLKGSDNADIQALGSLLDQLRATRKSADYQVGAVRLSGSPFDRRRTDVAVLQAETIIEEALEAAKSNKRLFIP